MLESVERKNKKREMSMSAGSHRKVLGLFVVMDVMFARGHGEVKI